jgi:hypothetical protein
MSCFNKDIKLAEIQTELDTVIELNIKLNSMSI